MRLKETLSKNENALKPGAEWAHVLLTADLLQVSKRHHPTAPPCFTTRFYPSMRVSLFSNTCTRMHACAQVVCRAYGQCVSGGAGADEEVAGALRRVLIRLASLQVNLATPSPPQRPLCQRGRTARDPHRLPCNSPFPLPPPLPRAQYLVVVAAVLVLVEVEVRGGVAWTTTKHVTCINTLPLLPPFSQALRGACSRSSSLYPTPPTPPHPLAKTLLEHNYPTFSPSSAPRLRFGVQDSVEQLQTACVGHGASGPKVYIYSRVIQRG